MSFGADVIAAFGTGTYTVNRYAHGTSLSGHYTPAAPSVVSIAGSVQPLSGRALRDLREGLRADDVRWFYTSSPMYTTDKNHDQSDEITIDGELYRVSKVEHFTVLSDHYRITVEKVDVP